MSSMGLKTIIPDVITMLSTPKNQVKAVRVSFPP
jgi:hypothetical protein